MHSYLQKCKRQKQMPKIVFFQAFKWRFDTFGIFWVLIQNFPIQGPLQGIRDLLGSLPVVSEKNHKFPGYRAPETPILMSRLNRILFSLISRNGKSWIRKRTRKVIIPIGWNISNPVSRMASFRNSGRSQEVLDRNRVMLRCWSYKKGCKSRPVKIWD